jgi:hypothetical protein
MCAHNHALRTPAHVPLCCLLSSQPSCVVRCVCCRWQPASLAGASSEFIFAARLDNLMMSYTSLEVPRYLTLGYRPTDSFCCAVHPLVVVALSCSPHSCVLRAPPPPPLLLSTRARGVVVHDVPFGSSFLHSSSVASPLFPFVGWFCTLPQALIDAAGSLEEDPTVRCVPCCVSVLYTLLCVPCCVHPAMYTLLCTPCCVCPAVCVLLCTPLVTH